MTKKWKSINLSVLRIVPTKTQLLRVLLNWNLAVPLLLSTDQELFEYQGEKVHITITGWSESGVGNKNGANYSKDGEHNTRQTLLAQHMTLWLTVARSR